MPNFAMPPGFLLAGFPRHDGKVVVLAVPQAWYMDFKVANGIAQPTEITVTASGPSQMCQAADWASALALLKA